MDISSLNIGILHSLVGKNDGVSIVIDQTVKAMVEHIGIPLGNIFFLAAHAPSRFNTTLDGVFWHKNEVNKRCVKYFSQEPPDSFEPYLKKQVDYARNVLEQFIGKHQIDLLIAHNTSHPYNFVAGVALGQLLEERRKNGIIVPRCLVWWHDSYLERSIFAKPTAFARRYLEYLPGLQNDGIVFINSKQPPLAKQYFLDRGKENVETFLERKTTIIPNTCDIPWNGASLTEAPSDTLLHPPQDQYNRDFLVKTGVRAAIQKKGYGLDDTVILLQHTRIVERKRIDVAIDFAFRLSQRFRRDGKRKCIALLVSGHSGDEQDQYRQSLERYFAQQTTQHPDDDVLFILAEHMIFPHREVIVDRKFYQFSDVPSIVAATGGLGTFFSEVEGFGNNLLEMISMGLPAVVNRFEVFRSDLEHYGFRLPTTDDCELTDDLIEQSYRLVTDLKYRNECVLHNLQVLQARLSHTVIAEKLTPLIENLYTYA